MTYTYSCVRNPKTKTWAKFYGYFDNGKGVLVTIYDHGRVVIDTSCFYIDLKSKNITGSKARFENAFQIATRRINSIYSSQ